MSANQGWVGVDLDGTLATYTSWKGVDVIGEPVPLMVARVKGWLSNGVNVRIFTARAWPLPIVHPSEDISQRVGLDDHEESALKAVIAIREWCAAHLGQVLPVTCTKDYHMHQLWDDRAVQIEPNTGRRMDGAR